MVRDNTKKGKVFVGLSGGVDSSVSAALLKKAGFDVCGVFIKTWTPDWLPCTSKEERLDAMRVAAHLGIPFVTLDLEKEYKKEVADYMIAEYKAGRTPNPDVMCNKHIKFGAFYDWAVNPSSGGSTAYVATGHYARIALSVERKALSDQEQKLNAKRYTLYAGADSNKDQSYFLWTLRQEQLPRILFPVGQYTKPEVRKLAEESGLPTADKKDSQGLCFMGKVDVKDFLAHYIKPRRGVVRNTKGEEIGYHEGAVFLTIGERHGFTITKKTPNDRPLFVLSKDLGKNEITVGDKVNKTGRDNVTVVLKDLNLISDKLDGENLLARVRYRQPLQKIRKVDSKSFAKKEIKVEFENAQIIAPGQSVVFYRGEECLGGGVIA